MSELESRTLWVSVWHSDMFGRNDFLGEVVITLADTVFDDVSPKWYPLQDRVSRLIRSTYRMLIRMLINIGMGFHFLDNDMMRKIITTLI